MAGHATLSELVTGHVCALLDERGMTEVDLVEGAGMGRLAVRNRLTGHGHWTVNELAAVADVLGVDVVSLVRD